MIKLILILSTLFFVETAFTWTTPPAESQKQYLSDKNQIKNGGFENGTVNWTSSGGSFAATTTSAQVFLGARAGSWDASSSSQTLTSSTWTSKTDASGNGEASCRIKTAATDYVMQVYDGTNVVESLTISASDSSEFKLHALNFAIGATSTGYRIRIVSASDASVLYLDDCYLGYATNLKDVAQASLVGSAYIAATSSCTWTRTSTSQGAFGTTSACPGPTVESNPGPGTIQTTDTDLPAFTVNNLPPGIYQVRIAGQSSMGSSAFAALSIHDGTTRSGTVGIENSTSSGHFTVVGQFTYATSGDRTFSLNGSSSANDVIIQNGSSNNNLQFSIVRYPLESQTAYTQDQANYGWTQDNNLITPSAGFGTVSNKSIWKKRVGDTLFVRGYWKSGTVTSGAASMDLSSLTIDTDKLATTANVQRLGWVLSIRTSGTPGNINTGTSSVSVLTYDGSDNNTIYVASNSGSDTFIKVTDTSTILSNNDGVHIEFSVPISGWKDTNVPALLGSVITRESAIPMRILSSDLNCDGGSAITSQFPSGWVSSIGNISGGACAVTLASGIFSVTPYCWAIDNDAISSTGLVMSVDATSTTAVSLDCELEGSTACTSYNANLFCMGPK